VPDYSKAVKIVVSLAPVLLEAGRQYLESRSTATPDDTDAADSGSAAVHGRPAPPPAPARRPTEDMIDRIRLR
jgi:hypothetical protein